VNQSNCQTPYSCFPESRDEILFRGEGCDSSCTGKLGTLFVSVKYVLVSVKFVCVYVKLLKT
jgi:hypothetical protein